jgi:hypothetical protein
MVSVEVKSYRVSLVAAVLYTGLVAEAGRPVIFLYDTTDRFFARINFFHDEDLHGVQAINLDTLPYFTICFPVRDYLSVLDLLRNEKPLYLKLEATNPLAVVLGTSPEPVGDSEIQIGA